MKDRQTRTGHAIDESVEAPVLLLVAWFAYASTFALKGLPLLDQGYSFQHAREFLSGKVLYRDILPHIPPLTIWMLSGWIRLLGDALWVERVHFVVMYGAILLLSYACLRTALPPRIALLSVLPMTSVGGGSLPAFAWYTFDATAFFLLGAWIHLARTASPRRAALASGFVFALSFLAKTNLGAVGAAAAGLDLLRKDPRRLPHLLLGFCVPLGAFALHLRATGGGEEFVAFVLLGQAREKGGGEVLLNLLLPFPTVLPALLLPFAHAAATLLLLAPARAARRWIGAGLWVSCALLGGRWFWDLYPRLVAGLLLLLLLSRDAKRPALLPFSLLLFSAALLAAETLSQIPPFNARPCAFLALPALLGGAWRLGRGAERPRAILLGALSVALFLEGAYQNNFHPYQRPPLPLQTRPLETPGLAPIRTGAAFGIELDGMLRRVRNELAADTSATFLAYPEAPALYVATGRTAPGRILNYAHTFQPRTAARYDADEAARLARHPPTWILYVKYATSGRGLGPFRPDHLRGANSFHLVNEWILTHYRVVEDERDLTLLRVVSSR